MLLKAGDGQDEVARICTKFGMVVACIISDKNQLVICDFTQQEVNYVGLNVRFFDFPSAFRGLRWLKSHETLHMHCFVTAFDVE